MDSVILVTFGRQSKCLFMLASDYQSWLKTLPKNERPCVMVTQTDIAPEDLPFIEKSQRIIDRMEREADEAEQRLAAYMKQRRRVRVG